MKQKIAIIGAGAAGMVTASWLLQQGHEVIVCDSEEQSGEDFAQISAQGLRTDGPGFEILTTLPVLTHDIEEAMGAERIIVCVSSGRQQAVAEWMAPYVRHDHAILLCPGNLGSVIFYRVFEEHHVDCAVLAELAECLWACRKIGAGRYVSAMPPGIKRIAALPSRDTERALVTFSDFFGLQAGRNILENSLNSPNVISHVAGTLLNLGGIAEKGKDFALFEHGMSDGYLHCMALLEKERDAVLAASGMESFAKSVQPLMNMLQDVKKHPDLVVFRSLKGPDDLHHRFIEEDASCGVAMLYSLAQKYHVSIPVTTALLTLANALTNHDYIKNGRTLDWLGMDVLLIS
ncbi:MAG: NAD/NADP octopine/nopaline dehydrogenase family protein [Peptococcaceae bacterium]|nr:NAD/NADP octopine/nopaline dehydrogenase family protein [Peptococcaceae bacterium]